MPCSMIKAHRRLGLEFDQADDLADQFAGSWWGELRLIHMCSQSDGVCVMIFASEEKARQHSYEDHPAWIKDHVTAHREEMFCVFGDAPVLTTHRYAARKLFERNGIGDPAPRKSTCSRCTTRRVGGGSDWLREFLLLLKGDEHLQDGGKR